jgi:hypothetical protein
MLTVSTRQFGYKMLGLLTFSIPIYCGSWAKGIIGTITIVANCRNCYAKDDANIDYVRNY